jgi:hypothetical protein
VKARNHSECDAKIERRFVHAHTTDNIDINIHVTQAHTQALEMIYLTRKLMD